MTLTPIIVYVVVAVMTILVAVTLRHTITPAPVSVLTLGLLLCLGYGVFSFQRGQVRDDRRNAAITIETNRFVGEQRDYESCVSRVATRDDLRGAFIGLYDVVDALNPDKPGLTNPLRENLDKNYPSLSLNTCIKPKPINETVGDI